jgi:hypothetical protein
MNRRTRWTCVAGLAAVAVTGCGAVSGPSSEPELGDVAAAEEVDPEPEARGPVASPDEADRSDQDPGTDEADGSGEDDGNGETDGRDVARENGEDHASDAGDVVDGNADADRNGEATDTDGDDGGTPWHLLPEDDRPGPVPHPECERASPAPVAC